MYYIVSWYDTISHDIISYDISYIDMILCKDMIMYHVIQCCNIWMDNVSFVFVLNIILNQTIFYCMILYYREKHNIYLKEDIIYFDFHIIMYFDQSGTVS